MGRTVSVAAAWVALALVASPSTAQPPDTWAGFDFEEVAPNATLGDGFVPDLPAFPTEAAGFRFGASVAETARACRRAGHRWQRAATGNDATCSGSPAPIGPAVASTSLFFCDGELCGLAVLMLPSNARALRTAIDDLHGALARRYLLSESDHEASPSCIDLLLTAVQPTAWCFTSGRPVLRWRWHLAGGTVTLAAEGVESSVVPLRLMYATRRLRQHDEAARSL